MTGDPGGQEDILGFGDTGRTSRGRRPGKLVLLLDRLTLRITRRPGRLAVAAGLVVAMLATGAFAYAKAYPAARPADAGQRAAAGHTGQCLDASQYKLLTSALNKIAQQAEHITGKPLASAGGTGTVLGYVSGSGSWAQFSVAVPSPGATGHRC